MQYFNFNQLSPSLWDCKKMAEFIYCPSNAPIGEIVTIGRGKALKAVYIPSIEHNDEIAAHYLSFMPEAIEINIPPDADKVIQYVASIKGYLFGYLFMP